MAEPQGQKQPRRADTRETREGGASPSPTKVGATQEDEENPRLQGRLWSGWVGREFAGDQAGAAAKGEIEEAPLDEDDDAALEFDDVDQVDEEPDEPGDEAGDVNAENVGDGGGAADDGHVALVEIFEWRESATGEARFDEFGGVFPSLDGDLGDARQGFTFCIIGVCQIAEDENFGMVGNGEVGIDLQAAGTVGFGVETLGYFSGEGSGGDAAGPEDGARGGGAGSSVVLGTDAFPINVGDESAEHEFNTEGLYELFRFGGEIFGIRRENAWAAFHKNDAGFLRADPAEIGLQRMEIGRAS